MKREEQRILAGSLNILPPSDKTPENDAIQLQNWRVDQQGVLRGADTLRVLKTVPGGTPIDTIYKLDDFQTTQAYSAGVVQITFGAGANGVAGAFLIGSGVNLIFYWPGGGDGINIISAGISGPFSIVVWNGYIWVMGAGGTTQIKVDPVGLTTLPVGSALYVATSWTAYSPFAGPTCATGSGAGPTGVYRYYQTFVNAAGLETNPGPASAPFTASGVGITVTLIGSIDADVFYTRLYRAGGSLGNAYQVAQVPRGTPTYLDNYGDDVLTEIGIVMPTSNDPPPLGSPTDTIGMVGPYFNRLLAWKNNKLYWSQDGVPLFPGSADSSAIGNWVYVGDADDKIVSIELHSFAVIIYKQRTVWRIIGDVVTGTLLQTAATCGPVGRRGTANCGPYDLTLSQDGVFVFNEQVMEHVAQKVSPSFLGKQWIQYGASDIAQPAFNPTGSIPFVSYLNGTAIVGNDNNMAFLFHLATGRWATFASNQGHPLTAVLGFGSDYTWYAGDSAGNLMVSQHVADGAQRLVWQTRFLDQGLGDQPKHYQEVVIDAELWGATMTVHLFDNNSGGAGLKATCPYIFTFTGTYRQKFYLPLNPDVGDAGWAHISVLIEITPSGANTLPAIHGLYIYYALEERDASVRGTQMIDFHSERIQIAQRIEVDAVGQWTITISTDQPGNAVAVRSTAGVLGTAGARTITEYKLPPNVRGHLWRVNYQPSGTTGRLYGVRAWMREVGESQPVTWQWKEFLRGVDSDTPDVE